MKVLVTGGAGFIGRHVVDQLQGKAEIIVIDSLRSGFRHNLDGLQCQLIVGSILDRDLIRESMRGIDYVFHLAALVSVPESLLKPDECAEINSVGTLVILEEAAQAGVKKLIFSSSSAIYGSDPVTPKREEAIPLPQSPYASTKLEGEEHCKRFTDSGQLQTASLRYFNVYGPHQNPASQYAAAIPIFIRRAIANEPIVIFGDGQQTRDFIYASDVASVNIFFALHSNCSGIINVGSGQGISIDNLATTIRQLTNSSSEIQYAPERPGDVKYSVAAIDRLLAAQFKPKVELSHGLERTIQFFSGNLSEPKTN